MSTPSSPIKRKIERRWVDGVLIEHRVDGVLISGGKGDKIAAVAQPIARAIDKVAGTKISGCGSCKKMRERLNAGMTVTESTKLRVIEFIGKKLSKHRQHILQTVDERLKSNGK